jgi:hypothetical protein
MLYKVGPDSFASSHELHLAGETLLGAAVSQRLNLRLLCSRTFREKS